LTCARLLTFDARAFQDASSRARDQPAMTSPLDQLGAKWLLPLLLLAACAPPAPAGAPAPPPISAPAPLRAVFHISDPSRAVALRGLHNARNALRALGTADARFVLVVHGGALAWLRRAEPENLGGEVAELLATGKVEVRICANTMAEHHWELAEMVPGVHVVPSGTLEVLRLEREGFVYFHP
jgi:intracellular sulfur oxidation DsrE/DsrF family protein